MKRAFLIAAIVAISVLATAGSAFANFGPHGGYDLDTDACAGCHRAHTSFSDLTWTDNANEQNSALLVSSATTMEDFCLACHGDQAPGASTNVEMGIFDAGPSGSASVTVTGGGTLYLTSSTYNGTLNGGAFYAPGVSSMHDMEKGSVTDPMWGKGNTAPAGTGITCTSCHDVHGSSNYRLLKDSVNGHTVGGYNASDTPQPFVMSSEPGYPLAGVAGSLVDGWLKHQPGAAQMVAYRPNYTAARYLYGDTTPEEYSVDGVRTMSTWCAACHEAYDETTSNYDYGVYESNGVYSRNASGTLTVSGNTASLGSRARHRHPVDVPVGAANTINGFGTNAVTSTVLPLDKGKDDLSDGVGLWEMNDTLQCLTCHRAHGSSAVMTGWANARLKNNPTAVVTWTVEPTTTLGGVNPNFTSALLRADNRGVCERCHNK